MREPMRARRIDGISRVGARQGGGECVARVLGKPRLETKQDDVNDHRGRRLGGCAVRLFVAAGFDGGHAARLPDGPVGFDGGHAARLPDGPVGFDDGHAVRLPDGPWVSTTATQCACRMARWVSTTATQCACRMARWVSTTADAVRLLDGPVGFDGDRQCALPDGPVGFDAGHAVRLLDGPVGFDGDHAVRSPDGPVGFDGGRAVRVSDGAAGLDGDAVDACSPPSGLALALVLEHLSRIAMVTARPPVAIASDACTLNRPAPRQTPTAALSRTTSSPRRDVSLACG